MSNSKAQSMPETHDVQPSDQAPQIGDYLWRPWYAKAWWGAIAVLWSCALVVMLFDVRVPHELDFVQYLAIVLHPQAALFVLGFLYLWNLFAYHRNHEDDPADEALYEGGNGVGFHWPGGNPTDPLDPIWLTHPLNPSSQAWRDEHLRDHG